MALEAILDFLLPRNASKKTASMDETMVEY